jgi:hypothetical protein
MILEFTLDFHGPDLAGLGISIRGHPYAKQSSLNFGSAAHMLTSLFSVLKPVKVQPIIMNAYTPFGKQMRSVHRPLVASAIQAPELPCAFAQKSNFS